MNPMRFYLVFDVQGNASQELSRLSTQFVELGAAGMQASGGVQSFHGTVIAAIHGLRQLEEVGHGATEMGYGMLHVLGLLAGSVTQNAMEFESLRARMDFAFGDVASGSIWRNVEKYAVESVYQFNEVAGIVGQLGIAIPGVAAEFESLGNNYRSRNGDMVNAFQVLGDTAAGTGRSINMVGYEAMQMMAGVWRGAHQVLHLTHQETNRIKHAIQATTDTAAQFSSIMQVLAAHYGGATDRMSQTLAFLRLQIPDILQIIQARIGKDGLGFISRGLSELVVFLRQLSDNREFISSLSSAFAMVAEAGGRLMHVMVAAGRSIADFISHHPGAVRFAVVLTAMLGVLTVIGGTLLTLAAGMGVFIASMSLAGGAIFSVLGMTGVSIAGVVAGMGAMISIGAMFYRAYQDNLGGIADKFYGLKIIVVALSEALKNWNGDMTHISVASGAALQNAGLLDFFVNLVSWIRRAQEWWSGFVQGMEAGFARINWNGITQGMDALGRALAIIGIQLNLLDPAADTSFDTMQRRGFDFANILNNVIVPAMNFLIDLFRLGAMAVENLIVPGIQKAASAALFLMQNFDGIKGVLFTISAIMFPIPTLIFGLISATGTWEVALLAVKAIFDTIANVVSFIGTVMAGVGSVVSSIGRGFTPPDSAPAPATSYVSTSTRTLDDDRRERWNPNENGAPTYVNDTGGASTEQSPQQIRLQMPTGPSGPLPTQLPGTDLTSILTQIRDRLPATPAAPAAATPAAPATPGPTAMADLVEAVHDIWGQRQGHIPNSMG